MIWHSGKPYVSEALHYTSGGLIWGANSFEGSVDLSDISDNVFHMQLELTNFAGNMQKFNAGQRTSTV